MKPSSYLKVTVSISLIITRLYAQKPRMIEIVQESVKVCSTGKSSRTFYAQHPVSLRIFTFLPGSRLRFLSRCKFSTPTSTSLYSDINTLYAQNPVFGIVHDESVKVYPHMYDGNVQQNPLCVESCVTKEFSMSPRFSSTIFDPDANSVLLRGHLCTAVDSMRRKPCVRNCPVYQKLCILTDQNNTFSGLLCILSAWTI